MKVEEKRVRSSFYHLLQLPIHLWTTFFLEDIHCSKAIQSFLVGTIERHIPWFKVDEISNCYSKFGMVWIIVGWTNVFHPYFTISSMIVDENKNSFITPLKITFSTTHRKWNKKNTACAVHATFQSAERC